MYQECTGFDELLQLGRGLAVEGGWATGGEERFEEGLDLEESLVGGGGVVGGRGEAGALGEFDGLAVGSEFDFLAGGLVAQGDRVLGFVAQREGEAIGRGRLGGVDHSLGENGGEVGLCARCKENATGDKDGSAGDGDGLG